ncbi:Kinetochore protein SPC24-like protein, partial [Cucurbita argyrosperma subsp. sororia]
MGDFSGKMNIEDLLSYGDDLVALLKDQNDVQTLNQCLQHFNALQSSSHDDSRNVHSSVQDYEKKIEECRVKTEEAKARTVADDEMDILEKEIEEEINELDRQRISVQEKKQATKKLEQQELRAQRKLSMYASVTDIIPNMDDHSKISGHIVDRNKRVVQKFELDPTKMSSFDICNDIWNMINSP